MKRLLAMLAVGAAIALGGCAGDQSQGPTYPGIGTVDQKQMERAADTARLTYFGILTIAAEYTDLDRCGRAPPPCSSQAVVNDIRRYRSAAGIATKGAVDLATSPTKSPLALANAVTDAQRAVALFRSAVAAVRPAANEVK